MEKPKEEPKKYKCTECHWLGLFNEMKNEQDTDYDQYCCPKCNNVMYDCRFDKWYLEEPKQETTLEEATELFFRKKDVKNCTLYKAAKFGAKWQQERSYSEELFTKNDLIAFYEFIKKECDIVNSVGYAETHTKWFIEQLKKK